MSAKEREETLKRFSVPLDDEGEAIPAPSQSRKSAIPSSTSSRHTRGKKTKVVVIDSDLEDSRDGEYADVGNESDDSFLDDDLKAFTQKSKGKGKGKAKTSSSRTLGNAGTNPRVMLISLKAGSLGLNLTVANNVYL